MDERSMIVSSVKNYLFGGAGVPTLVDSLQPHALAKLDCLQFFIDQKTRIKYNRCMYKVKGKKIEFEVLSLDEAMKHAKHMNEFVTITGADFEVCGMFGVDSVKNGLCPDGVKYDWNKAGRIGRVKKERV